MKIYGWVPSRSYGEWVYVMASSPEAAASALRQHIADMDHRHYDYAYLRDVVQEFVKRAPDEVYEAGEPIFGEFS